MLESLGKGWNLLVEDESIFIHDSVLSRKKKWIIREKRPTVTITRSHDKTIVYGALSLDGKQLFRQNERFDSQTFVGYLDQLRKKFIIFSDRAT